MSRFIITDAKVNRIEPKVSAKGTQYNLIHFTMDTFGKNGAVYPKETNIAVFEANLLAAAQVGSTVDISGQVSVNQQGYLQLNLKNVTPKQAAPQQYAPAPQQPAQQAPAQAPAQYAPMPAAPAQQAPAAPANDFDDDIPF